MLLGVLDVGSNTIHLQVMQAHPGARPTPTTNLKTELRLTDYLDEGGNISPLGVDELHKAIADALVHAKEFKTEEIVAFATSAIREATNGAQVIKEITERHNIELQILNGNEEASMTFLAARRWLGWSSGRLLILDIGGGSLEMAVGDDEYPEETLSLPLGAARLTRQFLQSDPYTSKEIKKLEEFVHQSLSSSLTTALAEHRADQFVATSKTFRTLARLNEFWFKDNPKKLNISSLEKAIPKLLAMNNKERAELPGVSSNRALQIVAGAIVAYSTLSKLELDEVEICPWALREGIVLKWLDWMKI
ncbi:MAG: Ppx/GppA family phosphatase [Actinobacteria bacterium]|jgi:exopolyphosphatase/guanosine-5'-triphosphate,3'-diphosphate pyrophosphatase|nr:Ppx/GppA family phosphatase [Actinomycetota bacterium]NDH99016.1 Ppx/GppA family phosphatase [Actinomycetota bacterium]NDI08393.1 Ppx/GppA family phosphatase [Actinomycetota bacterium]